MKYHFPSPYFQSMCFFHPEVSCRHVEVLVFFIQSLCLLIGAVSPLTFKVIVDRCVFIVILNLVFQLFLQFFSVHCFCLSVGSLMIFFYSMPFDFCEPIVCF